MNEVERRDRIRQMLEEIQYLATKPRLEGKDQDLVYALELMTKAVGLYTDGEKPDTLVFIENCVAQAYQVFVCKHAERDFVTYLPGVVSGC